MGEQRFLSGDRYACVIPDAVRAQLDKLDDEDCAAAIDALEKELDPASPMTLRVDELLGDDERDEAELASDEEELEPEVAAKYLLTALSTGQAVVWREVSLEEGLELAGNDPNDPDTLVNLDGKVYFLASLALQGEAF